MTESPRFVTVERRPDTVALVRLDRPRANALSAEVLAELASAAGHLAADLPGAVVVWGGPKIFAAGADIVELEGGGPDQVVANFAAALGALSALPRAVVAAVNGYALGGGLELALACDLRVAGVGARLGVPEVLLGVIPGGGGTQRLARLIGPARTKEMVLTGRQLSAEEARSIGLVNEVVPDAAVLERALELAGGLAAGAVVAQGLAKSAIDAGLDTTLESGLELERRAFSEAAHTEDARIGIASFLEHGPGRARFVGR